MSTTIFLRFDSEAAARALFLSFGYEPDPDAGWQADGKIDFEGHRADYHVVNGTGVIRQATGGTILIEGVAMPETAPMPGYHVNLSWSEPEELIPDFGAARVHPEPPECRFCK